VFTQREKEFAGYQRQLYDDGVAAALEKSKRGGYLWMFFERPVLAREARIYIYLWLSSSMSR
jgi:hypothetical protein